MSESKNHHYVPVWYQKHFLHDGMRELYVLNKKPWFDLPDRRITTRQIELRSPRVTFCEDRLYSVENTGLPNDIFETEFYGPVDRTGAAAVRAIAALAHKEFINGKTYTEFFEFLSAQSLRTPRALAWLASKTQARTKRQLLEAVSEFRNLRCAMWVEGTQEVLVAPNDEAGFVLSDNPVTTYNKASFPAQPESIFPNEPNAGWKGTQTLFALDSRRCLVLSHLEYAQNPLVSQGLRRDRTNARLFGQTIARLDKIARRTITEADVRKINTIFKARADRYVAAPEKDWLYPEIEGHAGQWPQLGAAIVPSNPGKYAHEGETFVGYGDGSFIAQDAFGRGPRTKKEAFAAAERLKAMRRSLDAALANSGRAAGS